MISSRDVVISFFLDNFLYFSFFRSPSNRRLCSTSSSWLKLTLPLMSMFRPGLSYRTLAMVSSPAWYFSSISELPGVKSTYCSSSPSGMSAPIRAKGDVAALAIRLTMALNTMAPILNSGSSRSPCTGTFNVISPLRFLSRAMARLTGRFKESGLSTVSPRVNWSRKALFLPVIFLPSTRYFSSSESLPLSTV